MKRGIVMFAKAPVPGRVKTRLAASIGDVAAANLHAAFIADLVDLVDDYPAKGFLALSGDEEHPAFEPALDRGLEFIEQGQGDLGDRLGYVTKRLFDCHQLDQLIVIGSDSPTLNSEHFDDAFERLNGGAKVVFGPSFDGGYYLVALDGPHAIFGGIEWSTNETLEQSWKRAQATVSELELMPYWYDVDNLEDLQNLRFHLMRVLCHNGPTRNPNTLKALESIET